LRFLQNEAKFSNHFKGRVTNPAPIPSSAQFASLFHAENSLFAPSRDFSRKPLDFLADHASGGARETPLEAISLYFSLFAGKWGGQIRELL
jgi:hypothetical protein